MRKLVCIYPIIFLTSFGALAATESECLKAKAFLDLNAKRIQAIKAISGPDELKSRHHLAGFVAEVEALAKKPHNSTLDRICKERLGKIDFLLKVIPLPGNL